MSEATQPKSKERVKFAKTSAHITYKLKDGSRVPGASTIAKIGDDPSALIYWAWDLGMQKLDYKKVRETAADIGTQKIPFSHKKIAFRG